MRRTLAAALAAFLAASTIAYAATAIIGGGGYTLEVEKNTKAGRVQVRPIDPIDNSETLLGAYRKSMVSGTMAAGLSGASPVWSARYGGSNLAVVRRITISAGDSATAFTAGFVTFNLFAARSFTVADTGGTAATLTGNNAKLKTAFGTTGMSDIRIASTATLSAGTRTKDTDPMSSIAVSVVATAGTPLLQPTDIFRAQPGDWPVVLAQNEGLVIEATVPATGTWQFGVVIEWDEVGTNHF